MNYNQLLKLMFFCILIENKIHVKYIVRLALAMSVSSMLFSAAMAQEKFTEGKLTTGNKTFEVAYSNIDPNNMIVISRLPQYKKGYPRPNTSAPPLPIRKGDMKVDTVLDRTIIYEVLKDKLEALKNNREKFIIYYVFGQDGNVVDIPSYNLFRYTSITPKELALIDKRLRKEVKTTFKGRNYLQFPVIEYGREISF